MYKKLTYVFIILELFFLSACHASTHAEKTYTFTASNLPNAPKNLVNIPFGWNSWDEYKSTPAGKVDKSHLNSKVFVSSNNINFPTRFFWNVYQCNTKCNDAKDLIHRVSDIQLSELTNYTEISSVETTSKNIGFDFSVRVVANFSGKASDNLITGVWTYAVKKANSNIFIYVAETNSSKDEYTHELNLIERLHDSLRIG